MSSLLEEVLKLSTEEKIKFFQALRENIELDDNTLAEEELTPEQWSELKERIEDNKTGKSELLSLETFTRKLNETADVIRSKNR